MMGPGFADAIGEVMARVILALLIVAFIAGLALGWWL